MSPFVNVRFLVAILLLLNGSLGAAQDLDRLIPGMRRFNPRLAQFQLVSRCEVDANHAVVVVRGVVNLDYMGAIGGGLNSERQVAFGVFVVDRAWNPLVELEVYPTKRALDYEAKVDECGPGYAQVTSRGITYGDQYQRVLYFYELQKGAAVRRIPNDPVSIEWIEPEDGVLFFIGPRIAARWDPRRPEESQITPLEGILEVRREEGSLVLLGETQRYEWTGGGWLTRPRPEAARRRYPPGFIEVPGLPALRIGESRYVLERQTVSLEIPGRPSRQFLIWNSTIRHDSHGGEARDGIYEILAGEGRFFPLPQPDWGTYRKLRPGRVRDGYSRNSSFRQEIGPFQKVADRIWFGPSFYDEEGTTGIGGLGWFDTVNREFHVRYLREIADWSASALLADQHEVWLGLVNRPEGALVGGGLAQIRLSDWAVTVHKLPGIVRVIRRVNDALYAGTSEGVWGLVPQGVAYLAFRRTPDGGYRLAVERK